MSFFKSNSRDPTPGCLATLLRELSPYGDYYFVHDPVTDRILDIPESFAPLSTPAVVGKACMAAVTIGTMAYVIIQEEHKDFMFAYFSYCALALQCIYHMLSMSNSIWASTIDQPQFYVGGRPRLAWYFFNLSIASSVIIAGLWWAFLYDSTETLTYEMIGPHGVTLLAEYIDGFWLNRIPIRFKHWYITVLPMTILYSLWLYLQAAVLDTVNNPDSPTEDDLIYEDIDWDNDIAQSVLYTVILVFGIGPVVQIILFLVSLYHIPCLCMRDRRLYMDNMGERAKKRREDVDSIAEASMFY